jgi:hypothetical protein
LGSYLTTGDKGMLHDPHLWGREAIAIAEQAEIWDAADPLERACLLYLRFNEQIEAMQPVLRWRVEDLTPWIVQRAAAVAVGVVLDEAAVAAAFEATPTDTNTRHNATVVGWDDVPAGYRQDLQTMAERYGYTR